MAATTVRKNTQAAWTMGAVIAVMQTKGNAAPAFVKYLCAAKAMTKSASVVGMRSVDGGVDGMAPSSSSDDTAAATGVEMGVH